jgi:hypothetical protein
VALIICGYFLQDVGIEIAISVLTLLTTGLVLFIYRLRRKVKSGERRVESGARGAESGERKSERREQPNPNS